MCVCVVYFYSLIMVSYIDIILTGSLFINFYHSMCYLLCYIFTFMSIAGARPPSIAFVIRAYLFISLLSSRFYYSSVYSFLLLVSLYSQTLEFGFLCNLYPPHHIHLNAMANTRTKLPISVLFYLT